MSGKRPKSRSPTTTPGRTSTTSGFCGKGLRPRAAAEPAMVRRSRAGPRERLADWRPGGRVLELACGTGLWSGQLAAGAQSLTLVDSSPRALAIAAGRLGSAPAEFIEADIFDWRPASRFDCVFFAFWLSHVPAERFETFWELVGECLAPRGPGVLCRFALDAPFHRPRPRLAQRAGDDRHAAIERRPAIHHRQDIL